MRLLVVEDEPDLASALARGLRQEGYAVDTAGSGPEGQAAFESNEYDLVVLDLNLPGLDGLELLRRMRANRPQALILVLTARRRLAERVEGLDAGADDYFCKPFHLEELLARIRALLRRDMRVREPTLKWGDIELDTAAKAVHKRGVRVSLTRKEFEILEYLLRHRGEAVSQEDLLEHVWDESANPFTNTIRVHIKSLRQKLGPDANGQSYIETVVGYGYRLRGDSQLRGDGSTPGAAG